MHTLQERTTPHIARSLATPKVTAGLTSASLRVFHVANAFASWKLTRTGASGGNGTSSKTVRRWYWWSPEGP